MVACSVRLSNEDEEENDLTASYAVTNNESIVRKLAALAMSLVMQRPPSLPRCCTPTG
jgi:hypothetical protein